MPISTSTTSRVSIADEIKADDSLRPPKLELALFDEISDMLQSIKSAKNQEDECLRKVDKIDRMLDEAKLSIARGKEALETLKRRNEFLQDKLDQREARVRQAIQYWKDYGFDVKQLSNEWDPFEQYEFIYTRLSCSVQLKHENRKLEIVNQMPEVIVSDLLTELNGRLTASCVQDNGQVDYKLAMIMIKKVLTKVAPKTSSHLSTETNSRTCT